MKTCINCKFTQYANTTTEAGVLAVLVCNNRKIENLLTEEHLQIAKDQNLKIIAVCDQVKRHPDWCGPTANWFEPKNAC